MKSPILFTAGERSFALDDALVFAGRSGLLSDLRDETGEALACREYAREAGYELPAGALQHAVEQWRYSRRLISARATMAWLERQGLTINDLAGHLEIRLWRDRFSREREEIVRDYPPPPQDIDSRLRRDLILSGRLDALARRFAGHVAALIECHGSVPETLAALSPAGDIRARLVTEESCRDEFAATRADLLRLEFESAWFSNPDEAREALLCVEEDGEPLREICLRAGARYQRTVSFAGDLPPGLRADCFSASPGESFDAPPESGGAGIVRLLGKHEPDLASTIVRERVEERVLEAALAVLVERHIHWTTE